MQNRWQNANQLEKEKKIKNLEILLEYFSKRRLQHKNSFFK